MRRRDEGGRRADAVHRSPEAGAADRTVGVAVAVVAAPGRRPATPAEDAATAGGHRVMQEAAGEMPAGSAAAMLARDAGMAARLRVTQAKGAATQVAVGGAMPAADAETRAISRETTPVAGVATQAISPETIPVAGVATRAAAAMPTTTRPDRDRDKGAGEAIPAGRMVPPSSRT